MNVDREERHFADAGAADRAVQGFEDRGGAARSLQVEASDEPQPNDVMASPTVLSTAQVKGAALWALVGVVLVGGLGALLGWLYPIDGYSAATTAELFGLCGALAGGTAGMVYGGGRRPEIEEEAADPDASVASGDIRIIAVKGHTDPASLTVDRSTQLREEHRATR